MSTYVLKSVDLIFTWCVKLNFMKLSVVFFIFGLIAFFLPFINDGFSGTNSIYEPIIYQTSIKADLMRELCESAYLNTHEENYDI